MTPPDLTPGNEPGDAHGRDQALASVRRFGVLLVGSAVVLVVGGALWRGIDFGVAVLIGSSVVIANFWWTKRLVQSVVLDGRPKVLLTASYLIKLGLSALVLYVALVTLALSGLGIVIGVSCLVPAVAILAVQGTGK